MTDISVFFTDGDTEFALEAVKFNPSNLEPGEDGEMWSLTFSILARDSGLETNPQKIINIMGTRCMYDTYKEALIAGYMISELLSFETSAPTALVQTWDKDGELVLDKEIDMDEVAKWYHQTR